MNQNILQEKLLAGKTIYILDDIEEAAVRLVYDGKATKAFIKHHGCKEVSIPQSNETVCDIVLYGKEVSMQEYDGY